jgi:competence protein ComEA
MKKTLIAFLATWGIAGGVMAAPVDINTADARTLARELNGVGLDRAQAIVDYRTQNGPFRSVDELVKVKGVGKKTVEKNRANLLISSAR